jgi:cytochrome P450
MDAQSDEIEEYDESVKIDHTQTRIAKKLTTDEIQKNLVIFMLAGYETSSTALGYIFYVLATNKEEQEKVRNEIDEYFPADLENPEV